MVRLETPLTKDKIRRLKAGDEVALCGVVFTARDAAHQRMLDSIRRRKKLPVELKNQIIYYCGPTPAPPGKVIGSCGPTTSSRMDPFTPALLKIGLKGMIGKGKRSEKVRQAVKRYGAVYFLAMGGLGALLSKSVIGAEAVAYKDLGPEAIYRLELVDFPLIVGVDSSGKGVHGIA